MIENLKMHTADIADTNIKKIGEMFPNCITERLDENGKPERAIDFDKLKSELFSEIVKPNEERYRMMWPNKRMAVLNANSPITKTLRPCREKSKNFDTTQNLYIEGDNLDVLKCLRETYLGKLDVIYIDPPYNTGNDILYINDYSDSEDEFGQKYEVDELGNRLYTNSDSNGRYHTNWMNMMYERVKVAKDLLNISGFMLIAIDHNELFNLGEICDEIFGYSNRIGIISVVHKPEGRNQAKFIGPSNEFMLIYAKDETVAKLQKVVLDEEQSALFAERDDNGAYRLKNFIRLSDGKYATRENKPTFWYPIYVSLDLKELSAIEKEGFTAVYPITDNGVERTWKTTKDTFVERYEAGDIIAVKDDGTIRIFEKLREDQVIKTHWIDKKYHGYHYGTKLLDDLLGVKTFDFPKSLYLMKDIVKLFCPLNGIILDFFSGSATTAHATMLLNSEDGGDRHFILVQIPALCDKKSEAYKSGFNNICEIGEERIRRAGTQIKNQMQSEIDSLSLQLEKMLTAKPSATAALFSQAEQQEMLSKALQQEAQPIKDKLDELLYKLLKLDTGFRVLKLDTSNMEDVYYKPEEFSELQLFEDNVKPDRTPEDLLFQVMLECNLPLSARIEKKTIAGKEVFNVNDGYLLACFDEDVNEEVITEVAKQKPYYFIMRDKSLSSDNVADNFEQIFNAYSKDTIRKIL